MPKLGDFFSFIFNYLEERGDGGNGFEKTKSLLRGPDSVRDPKQCAKHDRITEPLRAGRTKNIQFTAEYAEEEQQKRC